MRGDEPALSVEIDPNLDEFPACAGMNRHYTTERTPTDWEFPACAGMNRRQWRLSSAMFASSPHARG